MKNGRDSYIMGILGFLNYNPLGILGKESKTYSVIIPVLKREGNPYLEDLLNNLEKQSVKPLEVHLVVGDRRQGRAINFGVSKASSTFVATLDDDSHIDDDQLFEKLLASLEEDASIGMAGAACEIPAWASPFQKKAMIQIPRRYFPVQEATIASDMVQHPCLILRKALFEKIGGEDEELIRGLDPVLRKKVRDENLKVCIIKDTWVYHLLPGSALQLWRMYYRNGRGSGFACRHFADRVLELTDGYDEGQFVENRGAIYRYGRRMLGMGRSFLTGQWIKGMTDMAYIFGYLHERLLPADEKLAIAPKVESIQSMREERFSYELHEHQVRLQA